MSFTNDRVLVYPQCKDFSFEETSSGYAASVTFLQLPTGQTLAGEVQQNLPIMGESFPSYISTNEDYSELIAVRRYFKGWVGNSISCGKFWGVDYASNAFNIQTAEPLTEDELPRSMEISGEMVAWEPSGKTFNYHWSGGQAIKQPQFRPVTTFKIPVKRVIKDFPLYSALVAVTMYQTNDEVMFGFPAGAVLFKGASMNQFKYRGSNRWLVELNFEVRKINGKIEPAVVGEDPDGYGWNWQINKDTGYWDIAEGPAGDNRYYAETDLTVLFETDPLGPEEDMIRDLPLAD